MATKISLFFTYFYVNTSEQILLRAGNPDNKIPKLFIITQQAVIVMTYLIIIPKVRNMMKYELAECKRGDFYLGPDSHLSWPSIVILGILLTLLRATNSRDIFPSLYGCRAFVNPKWLPLNRSLIKIDMNLAGQCRLIRDQEDGGIAATMAS